LLASERGRTVKTPDFEPFAFSALFAGTAALLKWLATARKGGWRRLLPIVLANAFWGGLAGWAMRALWPDIPGELLGVIAALFGHAGYEVTVAALDELVLRKYAPKKGE
jgi:hypothetical protein